MLGCCIWLLVEVGLGLGLAGWVWWVWLIGLFVFMGWCSFVVVVDGGLYV